MDLKRAGELCKTVNLLVVISKLPIFSDTLTKEK